MIIKSIHIKEGMFERNVTFSNSNNLIYSSKNTQGKTTLLRLLLYGIGYSIPNTKKIKFDNCTVSVKLETEKKGLLILTRYNSYTIEVSENDNSNKNTYILPDQFFELQELLWGISNIDVINNLLGSYYIDQEKGWTLLNRGIVIGSIHFNIEELIRGLSNIDCSELILKEKKLKKEVDKYKQIHNIAQYRAALEEESGSLIANESSTQIDNTLDMLLNDQRRIKSELRRIDRVLSDNNRFKQYISELKLIVRSPEGAEFPVTEQNIVGLNDSIDLLIAKKRFLAVQYSKISREIEKLQIENQSNDENDQQMSFFEIETETLSEKFDRSIYKMSVNPVAVKQELDELQEKLRGIKEEITRVTKQNNSILSDINKNIIKYATELGIGDKDTIPVSYLFTSNLKELTGALLHKTVFSFRLAYIIAIEETLKIKLPIILDSPKGKEVDSENIKMMMDILKRDFSDHQIIIASIYQYDFPNLNIISIKDRLIDKPIEN